MKIIIRTPTTVLLGRPCPQCAFTLVELLVVIAILGLLLAMTGLGAAGSQTAQKLKTESLNLAGEMHNAVLESVTNNRAVLLRFYEHEDPSQPGAEKKWRGWQMLKRTDTAEVKPITELHRLESGVIMNDDPQFSTVFSNAALSQGAQTAKSGTDPFLSAGIGYNYRYLEIEVRPNGSNSLKWDAINRTWSVVFVAEHGKPSADPQIPADNYRAVLIDPFNTRATVY